MVRLMHSCWDPSPARRPSFESIVEAFEGTDAQIAAAGGRRGKAGSGSGSGSGKGSGKGKGKGQGRGFGRKSRLEEKQGSGGQGQGQGVGRCILADYFGQDMVLRRGSSHAAAGGGGGGADDEGAVARSAHWKEAVVYPEDRTRLRRTSISILEVSAANFDIDEKDLSWGAQIGSGSYGDAPRER